MKKLFGSFVIGSAKFINTLLNVLMIIICSLIEVCEQIKSILKTVGCFIMMSAILIIPLLLLTFRLPKWVYLIFILSFIFPILGRKFVHRLEYWQYSLVESMKEYGLYLRGERNQYRSFEYFSNNFFEQEEKKRRERQRQEQEMWEARFREFFGDSFYYTDFTTNGNFYDFGTYTNSGTSSNSRNYGNPVSDFVQQYESYCELLEVPYNVDDYQLKLQYRKLAKRYHPDLNQEPGAKEKFQEINNAYDFLATEENRTRYAQFKH